MHCDVISFCCGACDGLLNYREANEGCLKQIEKEQARTVNRMMIEENTTFTSKMMPRVIYIYMSEGVIRGWRTKRRKKCVGRSKFRTGMERWLWVLRGFFAQLAMVLTFQGARWRSMVGLAFLRVFWVPSMPPGVVRCSCRLWNMQKVYRFIIFFTPIPQVSTISCTVSGMPLVWMRHVEKVCDSAMNQSTIFALQVLW